MSERDAVAKALSILAGHLEVTAAEIREVLKELAPETAIPRLDLAELEEKPWTTYRTKERAKPGEAAWLKNPLYFRDIKDEATIELARAIERVGKLELGQYLFQFSGKDKQFISRRPLKR